MTNENDISLATHDSSFTIPTNNSYDNGIPKHKSSESPNPSIDTSPHAEPVAPQSERNPNTFATTSIGRLIKKWKGSNMVETAGIAPVPLELRTNRNLYEISMMLFSGNIIMVNFSTGVLGPTFYNLRLRETLIVLIMADVFISIVPVCFTLFGPKLGMRAMVHARYSWGYYGALLPSLLNVFTMMGFLIITCIVGGQLFAKVSDNLTTTVGIVIVSLLSLLLTFCGYRVIHWFERVAWIPNVLAYIIMLGVGGKHLATADMSSAEPANISQIMTYFGTVAASILAWSTMMPDYGVYHDASASSLKIFTYAYLGLFGGNIVVHVLGAVFASSSFWRESLGPDYSDVGGLFAAILAPEGSRGEVAGKILIFFMALSVASVAAPCEYCFCNSLMAVSSLFAKAPRWLYPIIATAILIPISIVGSTKFFSTLSLIINIVGYWCGPYASIVLVDHYLFRRGSVSSYSVDQWNNSTFPFLGRRKSITSDKEMFRNDPSPNTIALPNGVAAIVSFLIAISVAVLCIQSQWFVGPIAKAGTGDIATLVGFAIAGVTYGFLRGLERLLMSSRK